MEIKNLISAKIVADSINLQGDRITTMELVFPRMILAEMNTHRMFTRNSASSRAIPFSRMVKSVMETPFVPMAWQKEHTGMQGEEYHEENMYIHAAIQGWLRARDKAVYEASLLTKNVQVTKQLANRLLEPFLYHKVLLTFTESENFFKLRSSSYSLGNDSALRSKEDVALFYPHIAEAMTELDWLKFNKGMGEIHIRELAEKMWNAMNESTPKLLKAGEWHIPYGDDIDEGKIIDLLKSEGVRGNYWGDDEIQQIKLKIATARCARLSYQTLGDNPKIDYEADIKLFDVLFRSGHFSPFEHIAKAMTHDEYYTHVRGVGKRNTSGELVFTKEQYGWSNNFKGFVQFRAILEGQE